MAYQYSLTGPGQGFQYSLGDDDDDLTAPLLDDPSFTAASQLSSSTTGMQTPRGGPEAEVQQQSAARQPWTPTTQSNRDPALSAQWQQAERDALTRYQGGAEPNGYGLGEGLRDYGGAALASIFDIVANKGHGLPSLMMANQGIVDKNRALRQQEAENAGQFALKARAQKDTSLQNELALKRIQQEDARYGIAADTHARNYDPNDPGAVAQRKALSEATGIPEEQLAGLDQKAIGVLQHKYNLGIDHLNTPTKAADAQTVAQATQTGTNQANIDQLPSLGVARAQGEALGEPITRPEKVKTAQAEGTARALGTGLGEAAAEPTLRPEKAKTASAVAQAGAEGREIVETPIREKREGEQFSKEFADKHSDILGARQALGQILEGVEDGDAAAGTGRGERLAGALHLGGLFNSDAAQQNQQREAEALNTIQHDITGASAGTKEAARIALSVFGDPTASGEQRTAAIRHTMEMLDADIAGMSAARPADAAKVTRARGLPTPAPAAPAAPAGLPSLGGDNADPWAKFKVKR
jgi:hypothetical protein